MRANNSITSFAESESVGSAATAASSAGTAATADGTVKRLMYALAGLLDRARESVSSGVASWGGSLAWGACPGMPFASPPCVVGRGKVCLFEDYGSDCRRGLGTRGGRHSSGKFSRENAAGETQQGQPSRGNRAGETQQGKHSRGSPAGEGKPTQEGKPAP